MHGRILHKSDHLYRHKVLVAQELRCNTERLRPCFSAYLDPAWIVDSLSIATVLLAYCGNDLTKEFGDGVHASNRCPFSIRVGVSVDLAACGFGNLGDPGSSTGSLLLRSCDGEPGTAGVELWCM